MQDIRGGETRNKPVRWPSAAARKEWESFDREVDQILESVLIGDIGRKMKAMSTIIWSMGAERFGMEQRQNKGMLERTNAQGRSQNSEVTYGD